MTTCLVLLGLACSMQVLGTSRAIVISRRAAIGTTVTTNTVSSTPTNSLATAFSNQKKQATLSTSREVVVVGDTTTNAKFIWSDDKFATKTDYGSDIAGWVNGSIDAFVVGGVEYLFATWKQSGAGGGRTDLVTYVAIGTFNAGRTTLTWGTAQNIVGNTDVAYNYPDVRVIGTVGGSTADAMVVTSWLSGTTNIVANVRYRISSAGAITSQSTDGIAQLDTGPTGQLMGSYGVAVHTFPSVDANATTGDFFVSASAGTTGTGKGVRFRRAAFSAGAWTWGTEVEVSPTYYWNDSNSEGLVVRWDGTRAVVMGYLFDGTNRKIEVWDSTSFTAFTNRIDSTLNFSSTAGLLGFGATIDTSTGDVYLFGSNFSGSYLNVNYYKATRSGTTLTLGSRIVADTFTGTANSPHVYTWYSTTPAVRFLYTKGSASPFTVTSGSIT